jgi:hypothetical protein
MERLFPTTELVFYAVNRDLSCHYPQTVERDSALVFIHYFGHQNRTPLPPGDGTLIEDISHAHFSNIAPRGTHVFGSLRKLCKVGDGGLLRGSYNPIYQPSRKLDTWLRYEASNWSDVREAENMLDREWKICDMSSQSMAVVLAANQDLMRWRRRANEQFLRKHLLAGRPLVQFGENECPLLHARVFSTREERDSLRSFFATRGVFTSIHWPTHRRVLSASAAVDTSETIWLEEHILCIPVSDDYGPNDMEYLCQVESEWCHAGR